MSQIGIEHVDPSVLKPAPYNPRTMGADERKRLERGIKEFGMVDPIIARRSDHMVIGGHQRLAAAQTLGLASVPVVYLDDIADDKAAALNVLLNNPSAQGQWDLPKLTDILSELDGNGFDATLTGFDDEELRRLLAPNGGLLDGVDPEAEPEPPENPVTARGDVIVLGRHRLMCADSTSEDAVDSLLAGTKAQMAYCDPPYGVEIVSEAGTDSPGLAVGPAFQKKGKVGGDKPNGLSPRKNGKVFDDSSMRSKQIIPSQLYAPIIGDDSTKTAISAYKIVAALKIRTQIFWGGNYYAEALPPSSCWIVWDKDNGESFFADAELAWTNQKTAVRIFKHTWNGLIKASERGQKRVHPTQKPVALAVWCFEKYGEPGDVVLDLFAGSGSSLIAAEQTGRTALLMEMSEAYCDVIVSRWEKATGQSAVRPSHG